MSGITTLGELFDALAVDWSEDSWKCRFLLAGDGGQFVRKSLDGCPYPFYRMGSGDIPVITGTQYSMRGFIKHESRILFRGMFETSAADDGAWFSAQLTAEGYEAARTGVYGFDQDRDGYQHIPFFNPNHRVVERDPELTDARKRES